MFCKAYYPYCSKAAGAMLDELQRVEAALRPLRELASQR
jgi:hypothetical protein